MQDPQKKNLLKKKPSLPTRIVASEKGVHHTKPAVWTQYAKKINEDLYTIRVAQGDTVYTLSRKHGVAIRDIIQHNHLNPPFGLKVGSLLTLSNPHTYKVLKGETLYSIAKKNRVDVKALAKRNELKPPFSVKTGQELCLPASKNLKEWEEAHASSIQTKKVTTKPVPQRKNTPSFLKEKTPVPLKRSSKLFLKPVQGPIISHYGPLSNGTQNDGINISAPLGSPVHAAENGVVVYRGNAIASYGNLVLIKHVDHWVSTYAHLNDISVQRGDSVKRGQPIGHIGKTGHVRIPQLHFELRRAHYPVNPIPHIESE
jgi:murein DD-endopeptidase MepM/ murein hydrolase activator NlpD